MTSHPARSQKTQDAAIRRLLNKHHLRTVEIIVTREVVVAKAIPESWNPVVKARHEALFGDRDYSLSEATKLREDMMKPVAHVSGKTTEEAITNLAKELAQ